MLAPSPSSLSTHHRITARIPSPPIRPRHSRLIILMPARNDCFEEHVEKAVPHMDVVDVMMILHSLCDILRELVVPCFVPSVQPLVHGINCTIHSGKSARRKPAGGGGALLYKVTMQTKLAMRRFPQFSGFLPFQPHGISFKHFCVQSSLDATEFPRVPNPI